MYKWLTRIFLIPVTLQLMLPPFAVAKDSVKEASPEQLARYERFRRKLQIAESAPLSPERVANWPSMNHGFRGPVAKFVMPDGEKTAVLDLNDAIKRAEAMKADATWLDTKRGVSLRQGAESMITLYLFLLAGTTKSYMEQQNLKGADLNWDEYKDIVLKANWQFINDPTFGPSLIGDNVMAVGQQVAANPKSWVTRSTIGVMEEASVIAKTLFAHVVRHPILLSYLGELVSSGILFGAYKFMEILIQDAMFDLNKAEQARAKELLPVFWSTFTNPDAHGDFDRALTKKILTNMYGILSNDDNLRSILFYNFFRRGIMTGDFLSLVTTMAASVKVTKAVLSVKKMVVPKKLFKLRPVQLLNWFIDTSIGAAAGLVLAMSVPMSVNDGFTLSFQKNRRNYNYLKMLGNSASSNIGAIAVEDFNPNDYNNYGSNPPAFTHEEAQERFDAQWRHRADLRERAVNSAFESLQLLTDRILMREAHNTVIRATHKDIKEIPDFVSRIYAEQEELYDWKEQNKDRTWTLIPKFIFDIFKPGDRPVNQILYDNEYVIANYKEKRTDLIKGLIQFYKDETERVLNIASKGATDFSRPLLEEKHQEMFCFLVYLNDLGKALDPKEEALRNMPGYDKDPERVRLQVLDIALIELNNYSKRPFEEKSFAKLGCEPIMQMLNQ